MKAQAVPTTQWVNPYAARPAHLLTPREVARLFRVQPKTVTRWADEGKLTVTRTVGGHRRYLASEVLRMLSLTGNP